MKQYFLLSVVVVSLLSFGVMGVTAQGDTNATQAEETAQQTNTNVVRDISSNVVLRDIDFDFENERVILTFDSSEEESITITDALITQERTTALNRESYTIDNETRVFFDVEVYSRTIAITIDGDELYPFMEKDTFFDFTGTYTSQQIGVAIAGGSLFGSGVVFVAAYKRRVELSDEIERVTE